MKQGLFLSEETQAEKQLLKEGIRHISGGPQALSDRENAGSQNIRAAIKNHPEKRTEAAAVRCGGTHL